MQENTNRLENGMIENYGVLENGLTVYWTIGLNGGGINQRHDFVDAVKKTGKVKYKRAFEWCSGPGYIGYNMIDLGICEHIVFSDLYEPAIDFVNITAAKNNIEGKVTAYLADEIKKIPTTEKWDLVVANPPHIFNQAQLDVMKDDPEMKDNIRILFDIDYKIHTEFFQNITNYLELGADLYISGNGIHPIINELAIAGGLTFIDYYPALQLGIHAPHSKIYHFKYL